MIPKVSVMIPTYNYARFLDDAIQSVLDQTFTDFELVIVDNRSSDHTAEVVQKYLSDPRVSFVVNERNLGLAGNWNRCLELARGEYIKFLCADDKFQPLILERFVQVLDAHPDVSIVSAYNEMFGLQSYCRLAPFKGKVSGTVVVESLLGITNMLRNPSVVMFRKKNIEQVGRFNPNVLKYTDREFYLRLLTVGNCYIVPENLCLVRMHEQTTSKQIQGKQHNLIFERYHLFATLKNADPAKAIYPQVDADLRKTAIRSAAVMYEVLPKLHRKESRQKFRKALQIGLAEGIIFAPLVYYFKWKYIKRLVGGKPLIPSV